MITVVNYGMGNIGSLLNMCKHIGVPAIVATELDDIDKAEKIIMPGVGSFDAAMRSINERTGLRNILDRKALKEKVPILGVCLGMQLLTDESEEGSMPGLGWISGKTIRFPKLEDIKVPHMGWNKAVCVKKNPLTYSLETQSRYYFVHSYYVTTSNTDHEILKSYHGIEFASAINEDNIFGVQFHPEKSHRFGMKILQNFSTI